MKPTKPFWLFVVGLWILCLPIVALAQSAAPVDASTPVDQVLKLFGSALAAGLTLLSGLAMRLVLAHVQNVRWQGVLSRTAELALRVVHDVEATYVDNLDSNKDGVITADEKAQAKKLAVDYLKGYLGAKGVGEIVKVLGADSLDQFLSSTIEHAKAKMDTGQAQVVAAPTAAAA